MTERPTRRAEYAEMTQRAVVDAARRLFDRRGYAKTTVDEIAKLARVSPATIYAQCGGKSGLLETLMDLGTAGEVVVDTLAQCLAAPTSREKLTTLSAAYLAVYRDSGDILRIVTDAAASSPKAAAFLAVANDRQKAAVAQIIAQIASLGDLKAEVSEEDAVNIIYWHFRYDQIDLAIRDFGWSEERTEQWIGGRIADAILRP